MKREVVTATALIVCLSVWRPLPGLASVNLADDVPARISTNASTIARGLLQLAKHDNDNDNGDEEGQHQRQYRHGRHAESRAELEDQRFCGPYFKSNSVPYFRDYYSRDDYRNLPPGLRKHILKTGHLPPGLEKKYERTGQLPPGLQKRFECGQTFPLDYSSYLYPVANAAYERVGPLPPDSRLYLYGNDLLLLNDHTKAIIDVLRGAY